MKKHLWEAFKFLVAILLVVMMGSLAVVLYTLILKAPLLEAVIAFIIFIFYVDSTFELINYLV